jgi:hypothetical protein
MTPPPDPSPPVFGSAEGISKVGGVVGGVEVKVGIVSATGVIVGVGVALDDGVDMGEAVDVAVGMGVEVGVGVTHGSSSGMQTGGVGVGVEVSTQGACDTTN